MGNTTIIIQNHLDRLRHGDATARDQLLAAAQHRLQRLARRMLRSWPKLAALEESDDVLQAASLRLWRALAEAQPPTTARHFLRQAALAMRRELHDLARHHFGPQRQRDRELRVDFGAPDSQDRPAPREPSQSTYEPSHLAEWAAFHEWIATLPEEELEVFELLWYNDLTQVEAAEILGVDRATVIRRWQSVRRRIVQRFEGRLPGL
jgi:RNA polymerase sigma-70 factor (ECF subfamily)